MHLALTRPVPRSIASCELTHLTREPIDMTRARDEHDAYERALRGIGVVVRRLPELPEHPDSVFVEDTVVVLDEIAVLARPGATSRRAEVIAIEPEIRALRPTVSIEEPGMLDGGDVLVLDREIVVGLSTRTNEAGARQLGDHAGRFGYRLRSLVVRGCLHLKSAVSRVGSDSLVINPTWIDPAGFPGWQIIEVDPTEPFAANALRVGDSVVHGREHARTAGRLRETGVRIVPVRSAELAKAEGGVTCCCVLL